MNAGKLGTIIKYEVVWRLPKWKKETWRLEGVFTCLEKARERKYERGEELPHCEYRIHEVVITRNPISS